MSVPKAWIRGRTIEFVRLARPSGASHSQGESCGDEYVRVEFLYPGETAREHPAAVGTVHQQAQQSGVRNRASSASARWKVTKAESEFLPGISIEQPCHSTDADGRPVPARSWASCNGHWRATPPLRSLQAHRRLGRGETEADVETNSMSAKKAVGSVIVLSSYICAYSADWSKSFGKVECSWCGEAAHRCGSGGRRSASLIGSTLPKASSTACHVLHRC